MSCRDRNDRAQTSHHHQTDLVSPLLSFHLLSLRLQPTLFGMMSNIDPRVKRMAAMTLVSILDENENKIIMLQVSARKRSHSVGSPPNCLDKGLPVRAWRLRGLCAQICGPYQDKSEWNIIISSPLRHRDGNRACSRLAVGC